LPRFCPRCGTQLVYADAQFCHDCGYSLTLASEPVEVADPAFPVATPYPLPDDVRNPIQPLRGNQLNFQTGLSLPHLTAFYRRAMTARGLTEVESLTTLAEEFISLAFTGCDDEDLVVLQAVDLAYGTTTDLRNVNLRTEKRSRPDTRSRPNTPLPSIDIASDTTVDVRNVDRRPENPSPSDTPLPSITYEVYVDDNFHHMDESERYKLSDFESCEAAVAACKKIVDDFLEHGYAPGMSFDELYEGYTMFGEDPFIVSEDARCRFSAWDYARQRCSELCGDA
jgi:hypothetical protein